MNEACLRGFDFLADDLIDRLRFCFPVLSFSTVDDTSLYVARDLSWEFHSQSYSDSLTPIEAEQLESFATLIAGTPLTIRSDQGVVVMGSNFVEATSFAGLDTKISTDLSFRKIPELRCHIAVSSSGDFEKFAQDLVCHAVSVVDSEIGVDSDSHLSERCEAALFVLRNCSVTSIADLATYELMAACFLRNTFLYERLLDRFALELSVDRDRLDRCVRSRLSRPGKINDRLIVAPGRIREPSVRQKTYYGIEENTYLMEGEHLFVTSNSAQPLRNQWLHDWSAELAIVVDAPRQAAHWPSVRRGRDIHTEGSPYFVFGAFFGMQAVSPRTPEPSKYSHISSYILGFQND